MFVSKTQTCLSVCVLQTERQVRQSKISNRDQYSLYSNSEYFQFFWNLRTKNYQSDEIE